MALPPLVEPAAELSKDEVARYSRHLIIPDVGMTGQKRLKNAKVLVVGGRLLMLPGVGHVSQIEAPEAVAAGVAGLWDEVASGKMAGD